MKPTEIFRNAVIKATLDEIEQNLEYKQTQLLRAKGSWKIRSMGVGDAIAIVQQMRELLAQDSA